MNSDASRNFLGLTHPFQLGLWRVEPASGTLTRRAVRVHLQPKLVELLLLLVENRDRVVSKDKILGTLWPDTYVADVAVARCVCQLRHALGDDRRTPSYIQTIPKMGYRLIAPVSFPGEQVFHRSFLKTHRLITAGLLVGGALVLFLWFPKGGQAPIQSIAVLPFDHLSPDEQNEHLGEDVSDEIMAALTFLTSLRVAPRSSSLSFQNSRRSIAALAKDLRVETVLHGSVRQTGEGMRLTAQLVDARTNSQLWAAVYRLEASELIEHCWLVAREVASAAGADFDGMGDSSTPRILGTTNPEAYSLQALAKYFRYREADDGNFEKAVQYYHRALEEDPTYAVAYAGLTHAYLGLDGWGAGRTWMEEAEKSAARALELDDWLPDAHVAKGLILRLYHRDFAAAETSFRRALALDPHHAEAHRNYGLLLLRHFGRLDEALDQLWRAHLYEPLHTPFYSTLAEAYRTRGEYDRALLALSRRIAIDRRTVRGLTNMAYTWLALGDRAKAFEWSQKALEFQQGFPPALQLRIYIEFLSEGRPDRAADVARQLREMQPQDAQSLAAASTVALRMGELSQALEHAENAYRISPNGWAWPLDVRLATMLGFLLLKNGEQAKAEQLLSLSIRLDSEVVPGPENRPLPSWLHNSAVVHAIQGDPEGACRWLDRAVKAGWRAWSFSHGHPLWDSLQDTRCIQELAHEIEADLARMRERVDSFGPDLGRALESVFSSREPAGKP